MIKQTKSSLNSQIRQLSAASAVSDQSINFHRVIAKQQEVISSLQQEILMLKSYITLQKTTLFQPICVQSSTISTNSSNDTLNKQLEGSLTNGYRQYQKIIKDILTVLQLKEGTELDDPQVLDCIKQLKQTATKKKEPIFVERIKQIKVPITVEKIIEKPVEKIVERVVYIDRPAFKEIGGERDKYAKRYQNEEHEHEVFLNKTYSDRNLNKSMVYQEKYQQKVKYDQYKRPQVAIGNGLIKKRTQSRAFNRKDYY